VTKKRRITQEALDEARELLNLPKKATMEQIKEAYRLMALRYHPDKCRSPKCEEMMRRINEAYEILMEFCRSYLYSFEIDNMAREEDWEEWLERFYQDYI